MCGFQLWPNAGVRKGGVLIEKRFLLNDKTWSEVVRAYKSLDGFISIVSQTIRAFAEKEGFKVEVTFQDDARDA